MVFLHCFFVIQRFHRNLSMWLILLCVENLHFGKHFDHRQKKKKPRTASSLTLPRFHLHLYPYPIHLPALFNSVTSSFLIPRDAHKTQPPTNKWAKAIAPGHYTRNRPHIIPSTPTLAFHTVTTHSMYPILINNPNIITVPTHNTPTSPSIHDIITNIIINPNKHSINHDRACINLYAARLGRLKGTILCRKTALKSSHLPTSFQSTQETSMSQIWSTKQPVSGSHRVSYRIDMRMISHLLWSNHSVQSATKMPTRRRFSPPETPMMMIWMTSN